MRHWLVGGVVLATIVAVLFVPPIAQDPAYHRFADGRALLGLPNALNVLSNLPFAAVGLLGLAIVFDRRRPPTFADRWERLPWTVLFAGTFLTAFGSAYYHLAPDNARLVWDRLPMTVGFMGLLAAVLADRGSLPLARALLMPLMAVGVFSVGWWYWTELSAAGDLRLYGIVQFGSLAVVILLLLFYDSLRHRTNHLWTALGLYGAAKLFEAFDREIFEMLGFVSGHTLKHLTAAAAIACVVAMFRQRQAM